MLLSISYYVVSLVYINRNVNTISDVYLLRDTLYNCFNYIIPFICYFYYNKDALYINWLLDN